MFLATASTQHFAQVWDAFCEDEGLSLKGCFPLLQNPMDMDLWQESLSDGATISYHCNRHERWWVLAVREHSFGLVFADIPHIEIYVTNFGDSLRAIVQQLGLSPTNPIKGRSFIRCEDV